MLTDDFEFDHDRDERAAKGFEYARTLSISPVVEASFEFWGLKWGSTNYGTPGGTVTYSFATWSGALQMSQANYQAEVHNAFDRWEAVANIQFQFVANDPNADIVIAWETLDGASGPTLGVTYVQNIGSNGNLANPGGVRIGIDVDEFNLNATASQVDRSAFEQVIAHEIGHAIGLDHDLDPAALLYPSLAITGNNSVFALDESDISAIQILYGAASGVPVRGAAGSDSSDTLNYGANTDSVIVFAGGGSDAVTTGSASDTVFGGIGNDTITTGAGADTVHGSFGNDTISGGTGADWLDDTSGTNRIDGGGGGDTILGGTGDDNLIGGAGNDRLYGDGFGGGFLFGNDTLAGGTGNDTLFGGFGQDTFVFGPGQGSDLIAPMGGSGSAMPFASSARDFEVGIDMLDMRAFGYGSTSAGLAATSITASGGNTVISVGGTTITLQGVSLAEFDTGDLIWV